MLIHCRSAWSHEGDLDSKGHYCDAMLLLEKLSRALPHSGIVTYLGGFQSPAADDSVLTESGNWGVIFNWVTAPWFCVAECTRPIIPALSNVLFCVQGAL